MMQASVYGRLGREPKSITTKTGSVMATNALAVDISSGDNQETLWLDLVAFGSTAESLLKHAKGEMVSVAGRVQSWPTA